MSGLVREVATLYSALEDFIGQSGNVFHECKNVDVIRHVSIITLLLGFLIGIVFTVIAWSVAKFLLLVKRALLFEDRTIPKSQELIKLAPTVSDVIELHIRSLEKSSPMTELPFDCVGQLRTCVGS